MRNRKKPKKSKRKPQGTSTKRKDTTGNIQIALGNQREPPEIMKELQGTSREN